jgi:hypothetical protein
VQSEEIERLIPRLPVLSVFDVSQTDAVEGVENAELVHNFTGTPITACSSPSRRSSLPRAGRPLRPANPRRLPLPGTVDATVGVPGEG